MKKITISIDSVIGMEDTALIVLRQTGVFYEAQCNGLGCSQNKAEGFVINLNNFSDDFDECSFGCSRISENENFRQNLAEAYDKYCIEKNKKRRFKIRFDFERIDELMEGWIPVVVNGKLDHFLEFEFENSKGFIHAGNCD